MASQLDPIAEFDDCFRAEGGRTPPGVGQVEFFRSRFAQYLSAFRGSAVHERALHVAVCDIVENGELNACVTGHGALDMIGVHRGAVDRVTSLFFTLLSHPDVLPGIGEPTNEKAHFSSLAACDWTRGPECNVELLFPGHAEPGPRPLDPARKDAAQRLATLALDFLFFHEIGHLELGHLDYAANSTHSGRVREDVQAGELSARISHLLELNADAQATLLTVGEFMRPEVEWESSVFDGREQALQAWAFAVGMLFVAFDPSSAPLEGYSKRTHPHPALRLWNAYDTSLGAAARSGDESIQVAVSQAWMRAAQQITDIAARFELPSAVWSAIGSEGFLASYQDVLASWQEFSGELSRFNRLGPAPGAS